MPTGARTSGASGAVAPTGSAHAALTYFWTQRLERDDFTAFQASRRGGQAICRREGEKAVLRGSCVTVVEGSFYLP